RIALEISYLIIQHKPGPAAVLQQFASVLRSAQQVVKGLKEHKTVGLFVKGIDPVIGGEDSVLLPPEDIDVEGTAEAVLVGIMVQGVHPAVIRVNFQFIDPLVAVAHPVGILFLSRQNIPGRLFKSLNFLLNSPLPAGRGQQVKSVITGSQKGAGFVPDGSDLPES